MPISARLWIHRPGAWVAVAALCAMLAAAGCATESKKKNDTAPATSAAPAGLEIVGHYRDNYGTVQEITSTAWNDGYGTYTILSYDDTSDFLVAQNDPANTYNPNLFSRFDWTVYNSQLYYCQGTYDAATEAAALAATAPDRMIPATSGCGGFAWTLLKPRMTANRVVAYAPELPAGQTLGQGFYNAALALGLPGGSLDVTSLGDDGSGEGGSITLGLGSPDDPTSRVCIVDDGTTAPDLVVFENPFTFTDGNGTENYTEAAFVEVSEDGSTFYRFPATFPTADAALVGKPGSFANLTGINTLAADGDKFDLGSIIGQPGGPTAPFRACYVRIVDAGTTVPDYDSAGLLKSPDHSGADIDAVEALNYEAAAGLTP